MVETSFYLGADPEMAWHVCHHRLTEIAFTQDEFDELGSHAEESHPEPTRRVGRNARRIAGKVLDDVPASATVASECRKTVRPRFGHEHFGPTAAYRDAGGPGKPIRDDPSPGEIGSASDQSARRFAPLNQVGQPVLGTVVTRAVADMDNAVRGHGNSGGTFDRHAGNRVELAHRLPGQR